MFVKGKEKNMMEYDTAILSGGLSCTESKTSTKLTISHTFFNLAICV
jgi:hypothetical protein